jgi:hypothetical protein
MTNEVSKHGGDGGHDDRPQTGPEVEIFVDDRSLLIHRGHQTIAFIKEKAGVPQADQLQLETPDGLVKLDQNGAITIKGGEHFTVLPGSGSSS